MVPATGRDAPGAGGAGGGWFSRRSVCMVFVGVGRVGSAAAAVLVSSSVRPVLLRAAARAPDSAAREAAPCSAPCMPPTTATRITTRVAGVASVGWICCRCASDQDCTEDRGCNLLRHRCSACGWLPPLLRQQLGVASRIQPLHQVLVLPLRQQLQRAFGCFRPGGIIMLRCVASAGSIRVPWVCGEREQS